MNTPVEETILAEKARLRVRLADASSGLTPEQRARASTAARDRLTQQPEWQNAAAVLLFAPMPLELDVWPLAELALALGKRVGLPRYDRRTRQYVVGRVADLSCDVQPGWYGIREPVASAGPLALNPLDLILVPGVAFDRHGRRLGRGKGFYDRLLSGLPGIKCGIAFDEQMVEAVPVAPHDILVNRILTPTRWLVV